MAAISQSQSSSPTAMDVLFEKRINRKKQEEAWMAILDCFDDKNYSKAAEILLSLESLSEFKEFQETCKKQGQEKDIEQLAKDLTESKNPQAKSIVDKYFDTRSAQDIFWSIDKQAKKLAEMQLDSQSREAAPDCLVSAAKTIDGLVTNLGLIKTEENIYAVNATKSYSFPCEKIPNDKWRPTSFRAYVHPNPDTGKEQFIWKASKQVIAEEVQDITECITRKRHSLHINTGTHGSEEGLTVFDIRCDEQRVQEMASSDFINQDAKAIKDQPNVSRQVVHSYLGPIYPRKADHVIDAFCYSVKRPVGNGITWDGKTVPEGSFLLPYRSSLIAFGKEEWAKYFGDIGVEPPLPKNIDQILNSSCTFWPDKKVKDTHLLVLIPNAVNGRPFHLNSLSELIKNPMTGHKTQYRNYDDYVRKELGEKSFPPHWVLMTRDVIPDSRNKAYEDQKTLVQRHTQQSGIPYELPTALEAATAILMEYVKTGNPLYTDDKLGKQWTYTRCIEKVNQNQWPAAIGGFASGGLYVSRSYHWGDYYSTAALGVAGSSRLLNLGP